MVAAAVATAWAADHEGVIMQLTSSAFTHQTSIPARYTCEGKDLSPPLAWTEPPPGTKSFALIVDDPDAPAGTWVHWVLYNVPTGSRSLPEGLAKTPTLTDGSQAGLNDFHRSGCAGPCPPAGPAHHYSFRLYALDTVLNLPTETRKADLERGLQGHVLTHAELIGLYRRSR